MNNAIVTRGSYMGLVVTDWTGKRTSVELSAMAKARFHALQPTKQQPRLESAWRDRDDTFRTAGGDGGDTAPRARRRSVRVD